MESAVETVGSDMALQNATLAEETERQVSVRPSWNLRVAADS